MSWDKQRAVDLQPINPDQNNLVNYRNALYQGQFDSRNNQRQGSGVIYIPKQNRFISCHSFSQNQLNGNSFFYHGHSKFCYGLWKDNLPEQINIFRIEEILIIAEYTKGFLRTGSIIIFIFEKYSTGIALQITDDNGYEIKQKKQIIYNEQILQFMEECRFDMTKKDEVLLSLVKFINKRFTTSRPDLKLRLINNQYYRFGFDRGLALMFDDEYRVLSMGYHTKSSLCGVGVKYNSEQLGFKVEEGIFDGQNTFIFNKQSRPSERIDRMYSRMHLSALNFVNQCFKDPSEQYFSQFQHLLQTDFFKQLFHQLILNHSQNDSFRKLMESQKRPNDSAKYYQLLEMKELQIPSFKRTGRDMPQQSNSRSSYQQFTSSHSKASLKESKNSIKDLSASKISKRSYNDSIENHLIRNGQKYEGHIIVKRQFEDLTEKNKLEILKKQLYDSINAKKFPSGRQQERTNRSRNYKGQEEDAKMKIITKQQASRKNIQLRQQNRANIYIEDMRYQEQQKHVEKIPFLDQHLDIVIRQETLQQKSESKNQVFKSMSRSKSKKRIFEEKSIKRDYTPQKALSPFKSRMRSRIFDKTPSKSPSRSRSNRKIFTNLKSNVDLHQFNQDSNPKDLKSITSPHHHLHLSYEKSLNDSSKAEHYQIPITLNENIKAKNDRKQRYNDEIEEQIHRQPKAQSKFKMNLQQKKRFAQDSNERSFKRSNLVYINNKQSKVVNQHTYEPINIKKTDNSPYIKAQLINNNVQNSHTAAQKGRNKWNEPLTNGKKLIAQTSPMKSKMQKYLNRQQPSPVKSKTQKYVNRQQIVESQLQQRFSNYKKRISYF